MQICTQQWHSKTVTHTCTHTRVHTHTHAHTLTHYSCDWSNESHVPGSTRPGRKHLHWRHAIRRYYCCGVGLQPCFNPRMQDKDPSLSCRRWWRDIHVSLCRTQVHLNLSLVPRFPCSGMQTLKLCRWRQPGTFSYMSRIKGRKALTVGGCTQKLGTSERAKAVDDLITSHV